MTDLELRGELIATALAMNERRINRGKSGNVSARIAGGFLVTPTGLAYEATQPEDIVAMSYAAEARGPRAPSSEWRFHRDIYVARPEVGAIVHAHSPFATSLACLGRGIPAFHPWRRSPAEGYPSRRTRRSARSFPTMFAALEARCACSPITHDRGRSIACGRLHSWWRSRRWPSNTAGAQIVSLACSQMQMDRDQEVCNLRSARRVTAPASGTAPAVAAGDRGSLRGLMLASRLNARFASVSLDLAARLYATNSVCFVSLTTFFRVLAHFLLPVLHESQIIWQVDKHVH